VSQLHAYDVRVQEGRGRTTVRVLALDAPEAREQALHGRPEGASVFACRRSDHALGLSARLARRHFLEEVRAAAPGKQIILRGHPDPRYRA
jgi:hypothetical protein